MRAEYNRLRRTMRAWMHAKHRVIRFGDYADSRQAVQIQADAQTARDIQRRIDQIRMQLPSIGADPLGFRTMHQNWTRRRSHVLAKLKRDAMIARDDRKYARAHELFFAHKRAARAAA